MADQPILLILTGGGNCGNAEREAFHYAKAAAKNLVALQILTSDLYHYGHQDIIATRPAKRQFLLHIREEVLKSGREQALALEEKARAMDIALEIHPVESEDLLSAALAEAKNGYDVIFLPEQKRKLFPLFEKTLAAYLRKNTSSKIISC
jgi:hypothetical protein